MAVAIVRHVVAVLACPRMGPRATGNAAEAAIAAAGLAVDVAPDEFS